jgi:hypothetical protein
MIIIIIMLVVVVVAVWPTRDAGGDFLQKSAARTILHNLLADLTV